MKQRNRRKKSYSRISPKLVMLLCLILLFAMGVRGNALVKNVGEPKETTASSKNQGMSLSIDDGSEDFDSLKQAGEGLSVTFLDVGQGDAMILSCDGETMMIDGGEPDKSQMIYAYLTENQINKIDVMISTHPHSDHVGGLSAAFRVAQVGVVYSPVEEYDSKAFRNLLKSCNTYGTDFSVFSGTKEITLGGASVTLYAPEVKNDTNMNDNSLVTRVVYGNTSFLFTGDMEKEEEEELMNSLLPIDADVLKVGHHGSETSTTENFLTEVQPKWAVISVGKENSYGHPSSVVLDRLNAHGVITYRTDISGTIECISDGKEVFWSWNH